jgi:peptide/nickel transport system ATP-binding protein
MTNIPDPTRTVALAAVTSESGSVARRVLTRLARKPLAIASVTWLLVVVIAAVGAPWLAPYDPLLNNFTPDGVLQGPDGAHLLGTDENGRDVLSRLLFGARIALGVGFGSVLIAMLIGVPIGLLLGYRGGWTDRIGTRFVDIVDALPGLLVAFAVVAILGRGLPSIMLAIGLIFSMNFARMCRAITLAERSKLYIDAAKVSGIRELSIVFRQVLPNLAGPLVIQGAILTGAAIIIESALSFLGIGLDSSVPSWGGLLGDAVAHQFANPFGVFPPGLTIMLTVLAFNLLGDSVSEALSGETRKRFARVKATKDAPVETKLADADDILEIRDVTVELRSRNDSVALVKNASLNVKRGEIVALLGESGSGKSTLAKAVLGLLAPGIGVASGKILLDGKDIAGLSEKALRSIRGTELAAVFQDPMAALSPVHTIGTQLVDVIRAHTKLSARQARVRAAELLDKVGVRDAANRLGAYPHEFSGGMAQRVAIAIALSSNPKLVIADEATSALDVTTQAQVLDLLVSLRDEFGMGILLITHDLGVVAEVADRAAVMNAGEIVEVSADVRSLFDAPQHPYTQKLLAARTRPPRAKSGARPKSASRLKPTPLPESAGER